MIGLIKRWFLGRRNVCLGYTLPPPVAPFPHCDSRVLHAPGACVYCDRYPTRQTFRLRAGVNFTGETDPSKFPCPAVKDRGLESINRWHGNVPVGPRAERF